MLGFNSQEACQGAVYDIQTQAHEEQGLFETRVYREGRILSTIHTPYAATETAPSREQRMAAQHEQVCTQVREGLYGLVFTWLSRGAIAYESGEYLKALELFESVLGIDEAQPEANSYLERLRARLTEDPELKADIGRSYREQEESLLRAGRRMEAARKEALFGRVLGARPADGPKTAEAGHLPTCLPRPRASASPGRVAFVSRLLVPIACLTLVLCTGVIFTDAELRPDPEYQLHLGKIYLHENRILQARAVFYRILTDHPRSEEAFLGYWETFRRRGDYELAARILQPLAHRQDHPRLTALVLAEAHRLASRFQEASSGYRQALLDGWPEKTCKIGIGLCLLAQQDPDAAIALWEDLLSRGEQDYRLDYCLGLAYRRTNRLGRASFFFMQALDKKPDRPELYRVLGDCLHAQHQEEQAGLLWARAEQLASTARPESAGAKVADCGTDQRPCDPLLSPAQCFPFPIL